VSPLVANAQEATTSTSTITWAQKQSLIATLYQELQVLETAISAILAQQAQEASTTQAIIATQQTQGQQIQQLTQQTAPVFGSVGSDDTAQTVSAAPSCAIDPQITVSTSTSQGDPVVGVHIANGCPIPASTVASFKITDQNGNNLGGLSGTVASLAGIPHDTQPLQNINPYNQLIQDAPASDYPLTIEIVVSIGDFSQTLLIGGWTLPESPQLQTAVAQVNQDIALMDNCIAGIPTCLAEANQLNIDVQTEMFQGATAMDTTSQISNLTNVMQEYNADATGMLTSGATQLVAQGRAEAYTSISDVVQQAISEMNQ
jgi:ribosomal protein L9